MIAVVISVHTSYQYLYIKNNRKDFFVCLFFFIFIKKEVKRMTVDISFISIPIICLLVIFAIMWPFYTIVAALFPTPKIKQRATNPFISIIIPACNEERVISQCIKNFEKQSYKNFELIIICHNCTDNTYLVAKKAAKTFSEIKVRVIEYKTKEAGKGIALNKGLELANGELFSYFDADARTNVDFFENIIKYMESGYVCTQSKIVAGNPHDNFWTRIQGYEMLVFAMVFCEGRYKLGLNSGIGGTGVTIKTEIIRKVGGFGNSLVDDLDLCMELTKRKYKIAFARDATVYDEKPHTWSGAFKQRTRWFKGHFNVLFERLWETKARPHDLLYLLSPSVVIALWISLVLGIVYVFQIFVLKNIYITYYGITLQTLIFLTIPYVFQFFIGVAKEEGSLKAVKNTILYIFPLYLWTFIWYIVMFKAIGVKSWETTKTTHIGSE